MDEQVGGLGLKRRGQNVVGFVDEGARHESGLARTHPGRRCLRCRNNETTQDAVRTAGQNQKEDGQSQVLREVWSDHEQDYQGASHAERAAQYAVHGHAASILE